MFNYGGMIAARAGAVVVGGIVMIGVYYTAGRLAEGRNRSAVGLVAQQLADPGTGRAEWNVYPPQLQAVGTIAGRPFRYQYRLRTASLHLDCAARNTFHRTGAQVQSDFPEAKALTSNAEPLSVWQRSADHRPVGFGSAPGVDLQLPAFFAPDATTLKNHFQKLATFCSDTAVR